MRHFRVVALIAMGSALVVKSALACSPSNPLPTLAENVSRADHIYMARLVSLKRSPLAAGVELNRAALEEGTFQIVLTLKGPVPSSPTVTTLTKFDGGNCAISILQPGIVVDAQGHPVINSYSDMWILVVNGDGPYSLSIVGHSLPINMFSETDLRLVLRESLNAR